MTTGDEGGSWRRGHEQQPSLPGITTPVLLHLKLLVSCLGGAPAIELLTGAFVAELERSSPGWPRD